MTMHGDERELILDVEDRPHVADHERTALSRLKPWFNRSLAVAVTVLLFVFATLTVHHAVFRTSSSLAVMDEYVNGYNGYGGYGSSRKCDRYRRKISRDDSDSSYDDGHLLSWDQVMCHALSDNRRDVVLALAYRHPETLRARCSMYNSVLDYAIHRNSDLVEPLLQAGAFVSDRLMVDVACNPPSWNPRRDSGYRSDSDYGSDSSLLVLFLRLNKGDPNANYNGKHPMNCAASKCHASEVQMLLEAGAYVDARDRQGFTPLLDALAGGCDSLAEELINYGADIQVQTDTGENALQVACLKCSENAANSLLQKGIHVDHKDQKGRTALESAAFHGCVGIVSALLDNPFTNVNDADSSGRTALFVALEARGPGAVINMLLEKGADVNHEDDHGMTPLMVAATAGKDCQVLLQHGADVAKVDRAGNTALWYAASAGSAHSAGSLLQGGAGPLVNKPGALGKTPLAIASWNTHPEVAQVLVEHGADVNVKDAYGQVPLSLSTQFTKHLNPSDKPVRTPQSIETVDQWTARQHALMGVLKVLVGARVNLDIYDFEGFTPLLNLLRYQKNGWGVPAQAEAFSQAAQSNANFLLASGANPNMASRDYHISPLAFCAYNGYPQTAQLLLQRGADKYAKNAAGKTPAQLCGGGAGQLQVAQMLR